MLILTHPQGEKSFFLQPGESFEKGIQDVYILGEDEALICKANEAFVDEVRTEKSQKNFVNLVLCYSVEASLCC